jgi:hypothetical protein
MSVILTQLKDAGINKVKAIFLKINDTTKKIKKKIKKQKSNANDKLTTINTAIDILTTINTALNNPRTTLVEKINANFMINLNELKTQLQQLQQLPQLPQLTQLQQIPQLTQLQLDNLLTNINSNLTITNLNSEISTNITNLNSEISTNITNFIDNVDIAETTTNIESLFTRISHFLIVSFSVIAKIADFAITEIQGGGKLEESIIISKSKTNTKRVTKKGSKNKKVSKKVSKKNTKRINKKDSKKDSKKGSKKK